MVVSWFAVFSLGSLGLNCLGVSWLAQFWRSIFSSWGVEATILMSPDRHTDTLFNTASGLSSFSTSWSFLGLFLISSGREFWRNTGTVSYSLADVLGGLVSIGSPSWSAWLIWRLFLEPDCVARCFTLPLGLPFALGLSERWGAGLVWLADADAVAQLSIEVGVEMYLDRYGARRRSRCFSGSCSRKPWHSSIVVISSQVFFVDSEFDILLPNVLAINQWGGHLLSSRPELSFESRSGTGVEMRDQRSDQKRIWEKMRARLFDG